MRFAVYRVVLFISFFHIPVVLFCIIVYVVVYFVCFSLVLCEYHIMYSYLHASSFPDGLFHCVLFLVFIECKCVLYY
jgi:hypothetical protein